MFSRSVIIIFMCVFIAFTSLLLIPSSWVFGEPLQKLKKHWSNLSFSETKGTWYRGRLVDVYFIVKGYPIDFGDLSWRYQWPTSLSSFMSSHHCFSVFSSRSVNQLFFQACYDQQLSKLTFDRLRIISSAIEFGNIIGLSVDGEMIVDLSDVVVSKNSIERITGKVNWIDASWDMGRDKVPLGKISANIIGDKTHTKFTIKNTSSPVEMYFLTLFDQKGGITVNGYIDIGKEKNEVFITTLSFLSQKREGNRFFFKTLSSLHD